MARQASVLPQQTQRPSLQGLQALQGQVLWLCNVVQDQQACLSSNQAGSLLLQVLVLSHSGANSLPAAHVPSS